MSFWGEVAEPIGCCDATIHQEVAAGDKGAVRPHEECPNSPYLIFSTATKYVDTLQMYGSHTEFIRSRGNHHTVTVSPEVPEYYYWDEILPARDQAACGGQIDG
jgi:hypothetical protein